MKTESRSAESQPAPRRNQRALHGLYRACLENARELIEEATLLHEHDHHARAFALAHTAEEEVAKAHLVADYLTGTASKAEFRAAFSDHELKLAYLKRTVSIPGGVVKYNLSAAKPAARARNAALYVCIGGGMSAVAPKVSASLAGRTIAAAQAELDLLEHAEWLNGRIGSKALFK